MASSTANAAAQVFDDMGILEKPRGRANTPGSRRRGRRRHAGQARRRVKNASGEEQSRWSLEPFGHEGSDTARGEGREPISQLYRDERKGVCGNGGADTAGCTDAAFVGDLGRRRLVVAGIARRMHMRRVLMDVAREVRMDFGRRRIDVMPMRVFALGATLRRAADHHGRGCHTLQRQGKSQQTRDREPQNTPHEKSVDDLRAA